ncbi:hypothetical protein Pyrde_0016 [Pyrodictium delaneyi]|uniref:AAA+ ATPase domain-containing protein n=1 Tax=Pyrodictium delaneyi TaxID=1273541 RepID=A0A0P0MZU7_9CREN|nr:hypothetical protein [Pyrodictium delaneyi]ALL00066.1 hypothetical protein Pyrde_0016 [Pyrodictium delaneyi]
MQAAAAETAALEIRSARLRWVRPLHQINIVGVMGAGKTTLLMKLWALFKRNHRPATSIYFQFERDLLDEFWEAVKSIETPYAYVAIDDISFALSRGDREFLHSLTKIRHLNRRVKKWVVATAMHYGKATLPFLRQSHTKVLLSLVEPEEIESLRWSFTVQALWDYYYVYVSDPLGHWALFNWLGQIFITRIHKPRRVRCWDIVVNGPECV